MRIQWLGTAVFSAVSIVMSALSVPAAAGQGKMEATLASPNAPEVIICRAQMLFAKKVGEKTSGRLTVKWVGSGQLGGMKEHFEAVMAGNLEMAQVNNAFLETLYPGVMLFDLPFIFRDNEHMKHVVRGPLGQRVYGELEKRTGIKILMSGMPDGPRSVYNSRRPVRVPEDMKGLKLRVMQGPIMVDTFKALGAIPTPLPVHELYMAIKQGVVDGAEQPPFGLTEIKAYEVVKYFSLTKHFAMPSALGVGAKWFASLPQDYQQAIVQAAAEALAWYDEQFDVAMNTAYEELKRNGVEINEVANPQQFRDAVKGVYDKYANQAGGWELIQAVIDTK